MDNWNLTLYLDFPFRNYIWWLCFSLRWWQLADMVTKRTLLAKSLEISWKLVFKANMARMDILVVNFSILCLCGPDMNSPLSSENACTKSGVWSHSINISVDFLILSVLSSLHFWTFPLEFSILLLLVCIQDGHHSRT